MYPMEAGPAVGWSEDPPRRHSVRPAYSTPAQLARIKPCRTKRPGATFKSSPCVRHGQALQGRTPVRPCARVSHTKQSIVPDQGRNVASQSFAPFFTRFLHRRKPRLWHERARFALSAGSVWVLLAFVAAGVPARALGAPSGRQANAPGSNATSAADALLLPDSAKPAFTIPEAALRKPITIIAYGDMRFMDPTQTKFTDPKVRAELVKRVAEERPEVLLLNGDIPYEGGDTSDYQVYAEETRSWREERLRVFPTLGNHEFYGCDPAKCLENWWSAFPQLNGRRWYSVRVGANIETIALDSDDSLEPGSRQIKWLASQLRALPPQVEFVLITLHHPPVADKNPGLTASHDVRPNEEALRNYLRSAAAGRKAKFVVIAGHIHNYERFLKDGVTYLVEGGGGATPYPVIRGADDLYKTDAFPNYGYVKFVLKGKSLTGTMYRRSSLGQWQAKDRFEIVYR